MRFDTIVVNGSSHYYRNIAVEFEDSDTWLVINGSDRECVINTIGNWGKIIPVTAVAAIAAIWTSENTSRFIAMVIIIFAFTIVWEISKNLDGVQKYRDAGRMDKYVSRIIAANPNKRVIVAFALDERSLEHLANDEHTRGRKLVSLVPYDSKVGSITVLGTFVRYYVGESIKDVVNKINSFDT